MIHVGFQLGVDQAFVGHGIIAQVDAFRHVRKHAAHDILIDGLGHERHHGRRQQAHRIQGFEERHVGVHLILLHAAAPVAVAAAAHVPVGHILHEGGKRAGSFRDVVAVEACVNGLDEGVQLGEQPAVHDRQVLRLPLAVRHIFRRIELVDLRVQHIERISVPQGAHEFRAALEHGFLVEALGQPGRGAVVEVPADRIGAELRKRFEGIHGIALGLAHLLAVLVLNEAEHDDVFIRGAAEQQGALRH